MRVSRPCVHMYVCLDRIAPHSVLHIIYLSDLLLSVAIGFFFVCLRC